MSRSGGETANSADSAEYGSDVTIMRSSTVGAILAVAVVAVGRTMARLFTVGVSGPSMAPTLRHGDAVLAYSTTRVQPGDLVIARFRSRSDLLVVKRAVRPSYGGWWIEGDNPLVTDDSRKYGEATVLARVLFRYWRS